MSSVYVNNDHYQAWLSTRKPNDPRTQISDFVKWQAGRAAKPDDKEWDITPQTFDPGAMVKCSIDGEDITNACFGINLHRSEVGLYAYDRDDAGKITRIYHPDDPQEPKPLVYRTGKIVLTITSTSRTT